MARKVRVADKPGVAEVQGILWAINSRGDQCWYWKATVPATPVQLTYTEITSRRPTTNTLFNLDTVRQPQGGAFFDQNAVANRGQFGAFSLGNMSRVTGEVRTPRYYNEDFSILKNTTIHENIVFQLKFELLNAFNRHTFSIPDMAPNDNLFAVPNGTLTNPRNVQITGRINF